MALFSLSRGSFEVKLARKLQGRFFTISKRNKLLARWAFRKTNLSKDKQDEYVYNIMKSYLLIPNDTRLVNYIVNDLSARGVSVTKHEVLLRLQKIEQKVKLLKRKFN